MSVNTLAQIWCLLWQGPKLIYGGSKGQRRRRERIRDLVDIGEGYDTDDSFIDDSEMVTLNII